MIYLNRYMYNKKQKFIRELENKCEISFEYSPIVGLNLEKIRKNYYDAMSKAALPLNFNTWEEGETIRDLYNRIKDTKLYEINLTRANHHRLMSERKPETLIQIERADNLIFVMNEEYWFYINVDPTIQKTNNYEQLIRNGEGRVFDILTVENDTIFVKEHTFLI